MHDTIAREHGFVETARQKERYDKITVNRTLNVGDSTWVRSPGMDGKLMHLGLVLLWSLRRRKN